MICVRDKTYVIAVGQRAYEMYEKTPLCVTADSPMVNGAIAGRRESRLYSGTVIKAFFECFYKKAGYSGDGSDGAVGD